MASPDDGDALALTFAMPVGKKRKRPPVSDPPYHFSRPDLAWMGLWTLVARLIM